MRKKRPHYAPEFRRQMVELVRAGRSPAELENEFEPTAQTIRKWVAQGDRDEGRRSDGLTTPEREELNWLRRENRQLKVEREILSKAAAWFARETNAIPSKGSSSGARAGPSTLWPRCAACWASPPAGITRGRSGHFRNAPRTMPC